jgi:polyisoprenoid-binding protein YceI
MKNKIICLFLMFASIFAHAQDISFTIKNAGFTTNGFFEKYSANIVYDPANPTKSVFSGEIDAASINTDNKTRDKHLRADDYFDVVKFPTLSFASNSVASNGPNKLLVTGNLTIKGVAKKVVFDVLIKKVGTKNEFTATIPLNRRDFGVGGKSFMLSDKLNIKLKIVK